MKRNLTVFILILCASILAGYLNAQRTASSFFGLPPSNEEEKFQAARKELNKEIPLLKTDSVKKIFEANSKIFIDARNPDEYDKGHIDGAINIPQHSLEKYLPEFLQMYDFGTPFLIYCGGIDCSASIQLANTLYERGYRNLEVYGGGWKEWEKIHGVSNE